MRFKRLDPLKDLLDKSLPDIGNTLIRIPDPYFLQVGNRGRGKTDVDLTQLHHSEVDNPSWT